MLHRKLLLELASHQMSFELLRSKSNARDDVEKKRLLQMRKEEREI